MSGDTARDIASLKNELAGYQKRGYYLNPDIDFTDALLESLIVNESRYGYRACPCRLAMGKRAEDLDIICPCDYRDPDVSDFGACYCGLYVSQRISKGNGAARPIPERRPPREERIKMDEEKQSTGSTDCRALEYPVWRCSVCGYICARDEAPNPCPICGVSKDRFTRFC